MSNQVYINQTSKYIGHANYPTCELHLFNNQALDTADILNPIIFSNIDNNDIPYCIPDVVSGIIGLGPGKYLVDYQVPIFADPGGVAPQNNTIAALYAQAPTIGAPYLYFNIIAATSCAHVEQKTMNHSAATIIDSSSVFQLACVATSFSSVTQTALGSFSGAFQYCRMIITQLEAYV